MLTTFFVFGSVIPLVYWLSGTMPLGFKFSALVALIAAMAGPVIGFAWGALLAYMDRHIAAPQQTLSHDGSVPDSSHSGDAFHSPKGDIRWQAT